MVRYLKSFLFEKYKKQQLQPAIAAIIGIANSSNLVPTSKITSVSSLEVLILHFGLRQRGYEAIFKMFNAALYETDVFILINTEIVNLQKQQKLISSTLDRTVGVEFATKCKDDPLKK
jgi:hypothetical protein